MLHSATSSTFSKCNLIKNIGYSPDCLHVTLSTSIEWFGRQEHSKSPSTFSHKCSHGSSTVHSSMSWKTSATLVEKVNLKYCGILCAVCSARLNHYFGKVNSRKFKKSLLKGGSISSVIFRASFDNISSVIFKQ